MPFMPGLAPMAVLDPRTIQAIFGLATKALTAIGTFCGAVYAGYKWLTPFLTDLLGPSFPFWVASALATIVPGMVAVLVLWGAYQVISKKSKLLRVERFDLRVRKADELLGRAEDVANLKALIDGSSMVLVDGESGCGKSSLLAYGLVPKLKDGGSIFPILVSSYGGDWDAGLAGKIFEAFWSASTEEDRKKIGIAERPAVGSVHAETIRTALGQIGAKLGLMPVLILDQFDDYQLGARERFLGGRQDWTKPADLARKNRTWASVRDLVQAGKIRLVVVTRSDTSAGLHSVRFADQPESVTIGRLGTEWLSQWFAQATADDGKGEVIANPESGWTDLKRRLERDLTTTGAAAGAILPQQVRIVFLGLAKLAYLTPSDYRRTVLKGGIEALYVSHAIHGAASASGYSADEIRNLLKAFVDQEQPGNVKTQELSLAEIKRSFGDGERLTKALERLRRDEIVREKPGTATDPSRWRLDHDYIARAILAEGRYANRLMQQIEDGNAAWDAAGSNLMRRARSSLPLAAQMKLLWARLHAGGGFVYGPYRLYASLSAVIRTLPIVVIAVLGGTWWRWETIQDSATHIVDGLNEESRRGSGAAFRLWDSSPVVRDAVLDRLLNNPARFKAVGTDWVRAYTSIESYAASHLAERLRDRLGKETDADMRQSLLAAYGSAAAQLDPAEAAKEAGDLRDRLGKGTDPAMRPSLVVAYGMAAAQLDPAEAAKAAGDLRDRLGKETDPAMRQSLVAAYGSAAARLDPAEAAKEAGDLRDRLGKETDPPTEADLIDAAAFLATDPSSRPTEEQLLELRLALASVANPIRGPPESPAWKRLEDISGKRFDHDIDRLLDWLKSCCQLTASDARLSASFK